MNTTGQNRVQRIIDEGYDFKLGEYISDGFNILHKNLGGFIGFSFIFFIGFGIIGMIPIVNFFLLFITMPLGAGFFMVANKIRNGEYYEFGDFFRGFDKIGPIAIWILLFFALSILLLLPYLIYVGSLMMPIFQEGLNDPNALIAASESISLPIAYLLSLPSLFFGIAWSWSFFFVVFYDMSAWQALEVSRKIITKKFFWFLLFSIIIYIIGCLGVIALGIGLLYTIPAMLLAAFAAFANITGLGEGVDSYDEDSILDHLIEG